MTDIDPRPPSPQWMVIASKGDDRHRGEPHRWRWQARLERFGMACSRQWEGWGLEIERIR